MRCSVAVRYPDLSEAEKIKAKEKCEQYQPQIFPMEMSKDLEKDMKGWIPCQTNPRKWCHEKSWKSCIAYEEQREIAQIDATQLDDIIEVRNAWDFAEIPFRCRHGVKKIAAAGDEPKAGEVGGFFPRIRRWGDRIVEVSDEEDGCVHLRKLGTQMLLSRIIFLPRKSFSTIFVP